MSDAILKAVAGSLEAERAETVEREEDIRRHIVRVEDELAEARRMVEEAGERGASVSEGLKASIERLEAGLEDIRTKAATEAAISKNSAEAIEARISRLSSDHLFASVVKAEIDTLKSDVSAHLMDLLHRRAVVTGRNPFEKAPVALEKWFVTLGSKS